MKVSEPYQRWEELVQSFYELMKAEYNASILKAPDKFQSLTHNKYLESVGRKNYSKTQKSLAKNQRFLIEINHEMEEDRYKKFDTLFNYKFNSLKEIDKNIFLVQLGILGALDKMYSFLCQESEKYWLFESPKSVPAKSKIIWKGTTDLDFIQLVYSLKEAGYLDNEEGQITNLIKQVAEAFNYNLRPHWQSTLSDNVNNRNADYQPKIFEKLSKAFSGYRERQIESNKKKKLK